MSYLLNMIKSRLFLAFCGLVFLAMIVWYVGPLLSVGDFAPLASEKNRIIVIAILTVIWLLSAIWRFFKARRDNNQMLDSLAEQPSLSPNEEASAEEVAILQDKMQAAVETLKQRNFSKKGGSRFIYELPWYTIIGPPGAGKTTLLSNSGLDFPLEETHGKFSVKGVGGTRNCDWWFTDQAVLLDTAGRYTTQDSEAEVDRNAWKSFLQMLKEKRKRRPLNGVLIAISMQDLLENDAETMAQQAKTIRSRIEELYKILGIAPPIYLMITKCDLMAGFADFFGDLNQDERKQVWGFTLPVDEPESHAERLNTELKLLGKTINQQSIAKMHRELSQRNRENIYSFPMQFAFAQERIQAFAKQLTVRSSLLENVFFRGIYFTSATQTGSAIDQVIATVSHGFGVDSAAASPSADSGKSFFIHSLLTDVIFGESGLAGTNLKAERRLKFLQYGAGGTVVVVLLGLLAAWTGSFVKNRAALDRIENTSRAMEENLTSLPSQSLDILSTEPALSAARALAYGEDRQREDETGVLIKNVGLYQGDLVDEAAEQKYQELLIDTLLPRLMVGLEHQMHAESNNSEFVFEALKTYQMIGNRSVFDSQAVTGWFNFDIDANLPADTSPAQRSSLKKHIAALFVEPPYRLPRPVDQGLIRQYQQIASSISLQERAYSRLKSTNLDSVNAFYKITQVGGPEIPLAFYRADGVSLDQSVPLFFTRAGYNDIFLPASQGVSQTLTEDAWVLGEFAGSNVSTESPEKLRASVQNQYYQEYIKVWEQLMANVKLKPVDGLAGASEFIALVTDTQSPLKNLLVVLGEQTLLTAPETPDPDQAQAAAPTDRETQLATLLQGKQTAALPDNKPLDPVTLRFESLHGMIKDWENNASKLDDVLNQLADLNLQLLPMAQSPAGSIDPKLSSDLAVNLQKLDTKANRLPEPLASLVKNLSNEVNDVVGGGFCKQLNAAWQAEVYGYYQRAIRNRYPVNRKGTADIALSDFGAFFGRDGIVDQFVNTYLSAHVSKTPRQWTWTGKNSAKCLSDNSLKQLARAEDIKNTFFSAGGQTPSFQFDIVPHQLNVSSQIEQLFLDVGSNKLEYFHGPINGSTSFRWPDNNNNTQVNLRVLPIVPGSSSSLSLSGPWAILRLFDQGAREASNGRLTVNYSFSGRSVSLTMATSSFNPLNSVSLRNFRAPESL
ncbi:MAG: type VI secretion system membrane subunit TssM [Gammaproteobacteria bacterium]|nr:type VI secretion system membrane subunit TssM [Gammaproteobacteria bacterium]